MERCLPRLGQSADVHPLCFTNCDNGFDDSALRPFIKRDADSSAKMRRVSEAMRLCANPPAFQILSPPPRGCGPPGFPAEFRRRRKADSYALKPLVERQFPGVHLRHGSLVVYMVARGYAYTPPATGTQMAFRLGSRTGNTCCLGRMPP